MRDDWPDKGERVMMVASFFFLLAAVGSIAGFLLGLIARLSVDG